MVFEIKPGTVSTRFTDAKITASDTEPAAGSIVDAGTEAPIVVTVLDAGPMDLQIGANEGQTMAVRIPKVTPQTLGIDKINIGTADGAQKAIELLDNAIREISAIRSKLGAYQNRLEHSISNLDVASENMTESLSRIKDVDMAAEMAEYTQRRFCHRQASPCCPGKLKASEHIVPAAAIRNSIIFHYTYCPGGSTI